MPDNKASNTETYNQIPQEQPDIIEEIEIEELSIDGICGVY
jgi:mycofactocin precursor